MKITQACEECLLKGEEMEFTHKILSAQYHAKTDTFIIFSQVKCPRCKSLVTLLRETFPADPKKCGGL